MALAFSKILDHGTSHPVVARLHLQTSDLLKVTSFEKSTRDAIFEATFKASLRLIRCGDIQVRIEAECELAERKYQPPEDSRAVTIPHIVGLEHDTETFLYEAKNFLRDVTSIVNAAFGTKFNQASQFAKTKDGKDGKIVRWAEKFFGSEDRIAKFLKFHQEWATEIVKMRNAVEHPHGNSGVLHIKNYELIEDGSIRRPVWFRNEEQPNLILGDMLELCDYMLMFAEELVVLIVERHLAGRMLAICEIPVESRTPDSPIRFTIGLAPGAVGHLERKGKGED